MIHFLNEIQPRYSKICNLVYNCVCLREKINSREREKKAFDYFLVRVD